MARPTFPSSGSTPQVTAGAIIVLDIAGYADTTHHKVIAGQAAGGTWGPPAAGVWTDIGPV